MTLIDFKTIVTPLLKKHNVRKAALFGSAAKLDPDQAGDFDILVEYAKGDSFSGLDNYFGLQLSLESLLGKKVDLVEFGAVRPELKEEVNKTQVIIFHGE